MAQVVNGQVQLGNGQMVTPQQGGWYDGQQFWGGSLSNPGQINSQSNQQGAGKQVSPEVIAQTNPNNVAYIQKQQQSIPVQNDTGNPAFGTPSSGGAGGGIPGGTGMITTPPIDLQGIYTNLTKNAGITDLEKELTDKSTAFNVAQAKINDNPFLSEANRVGRGQKLQTDYNNDTKTLADSVAMKKADVQTQLDLASKQFDINSQSAKAALDQFTTLLSSGALDTASGSDIASITSATGMSSGMIQSAIKASQAKNQQTQVISFDDGTSQGFAVIDSKTGNIINKQIIGPSKPTKGTSEYTNTMDSINLDKAQAPQVLLQGAKMGKTLPDMMAYGSANGVSKQTIYDIYASTNYYHPTSAQVKADKKAYGIK